MSPTCHDNRDCQSICQQNYVCRCLRVTERELAELIVTLRVCSFEELRRCSEAGDGCTACHARLRELVARHACPEVSSALPIFSAK
jgi:bacterioferritin-associated ferredoxin